MPIDGFMRGNGRFIPTDSVAAEEHTGRRFPRWLTTGRILSQYNVGTQTRRTANAILHDCERLRTQPQNAEERGSGGALSSASYRKPARPQGVAGITGRVSPARSMRPSFRPDSQANVIKTNHSDRATNLPGIQGDDGASQLVFRA